MSQFNFHKKSNLLSPPPTTALPIIQRLVESYKIWQQFLIHFPTTSRHTLGFRIDTLLIEISEILFSASFLNRSQKISAIKQASTRLDSVKFLTRLAWEIKSINNKKYILLSENLNIIGRMIGGWLKQLSK